MTNWSPEQARALDDVAAWMKDPGRKPVLRMFGYAGTGKTTLARHLAEQADGNVMFMAYTGKAASVMRAKGCAGAMTIHSSIYLPSGRSKELIRQLEDELAEMKHVIHGGGGDPANDKGVQKLEAALVEARFEAAKPAFTLNPASPVADATLVIVDECSMVDGRVGGDLLSFGTPLLVLGDPAQLPPVYGTGFFTSDEPDIMLTEVHRQAAESPVLHLATLARRGERISYGTYGESRVISRRELMTEDVTNSEQILVGKNATRRSFNKRCREIEGRERSLPEAGDRLVCLRNDHKEGFLNGTLWTVAEVGIDEGDSLLLTLGSVDEPGRPLIAANCTKHHFDGKDGRPDPWAMDGLQEMDYGYALTVHKAQGSQWNSVALFDESSVFKADADKWLYTALTRAADRVLLVR